MTRNFAVLSLVYVLITGCTTMNTAMGSWQGRSIDDVTAAWGAPESSINRKDGGVTYTWTTIRSNQYGVHQCRQTFVTDPAGKIVQWSYAGCPRLVRK